jgi:hypothetical protein
MKKEGALIGIATPGDKNVIKKEAESVLKYRDFTMQIQLVWNVKTNVILILAIGTISKS